MTLRPIQARDSHLRYRLYVVLTAALYTAACGLVLVRAQVKAARFDFVVSDAMGYYAYLPSLVIDGDLDFQNQLEAQFNGVVPPDIRLAQETRGWPFDLRKSRWPIGVALSVSPGFLVAHGASRALHGVTASDVFRPDGYSVVYQLCCAAAAMAIGLGGMIVADKLLVERYLVRGRVAAAAVLTFWLGSHYVWFFVREPLLAHMIGASWILFTMYLVHRVELATRPSGGGGAAMLRWQLPLLALAASMALACRFSNVFIAPLLVYCAWLLIRRGLLPAVLRQAPLILLGWTPVILQFGVVWIMNRPAAEGGPQEIGYAGHERFYWTDPALVLSLFSSRRGLFFWTPVLLFSAFGLGRHLVRGGGWRDPFLISLVIGATILWYVNASWYAWWFGNSAGNRGYIELAGAFILGFGFAYAWLEGLRPRARRAVGALVVLAMIANWALLGLKLLDRLDGHDPLLAWEKRVFIGRWERF